MSSNLGKIDVEVEVKSPVDKFWNGIRDSINLFPKASPNEYKSIEVVEGDGKSVGSVLLIKYTEGNVHALFPHVLINLRVVTDNLFILQISNSHFLWMVCRLLDHYTTKKMVISNKN